MLSNTLPDISKSKPSDATALPAVGMEQVQLLINGQVGVANIFVDFKDTDSRGIHMSRLYKLLRDYFTISVEAKAKNLTQTLSYQNLKQFLYDTIDSHKTHSQTTYLSLKFPLVVKTQSLVSQNWGVRTYPVQIKASLNKNKEFKVYINFQVLYSSTCPCSASLAQELNKKAILKKFKDKPQLSIADIELWFSDLKNTEAFPHSQRSVADITLLVDPFTGSAIDLITKKLVNTEQALQTVVQAFVKREDEQAFANINAKSLFFCEDAARKLKLLYDKNTCIKDFAIKLSHEESLHPHNAVSFAFKEDGLFYKSKELFILN